MRNLLLGSLLLLFTATVAAQSRMNVVVVMTDDQRADSISRMPNLAELASRGVRFTRAYQPTPACAPARASMYSGGFLAQNTGVLENGAPNGGVQRFIDRVNLGTVMQQAGYRTLFVGKWINGYENRDTYVPPGWSRFIGRSSLASHTSWFNFRYVVGASGPGSSTVGVQRAANEYTTFFERDEILRFLDAGPRNEPFFVFWSPSAPHELAMPAPQDAEAFARFTHDSPSVGERDLGDKPRWVRENKDPPDDPEFVRDQLRSLRSVDRALGDIVAKLEATGEAGSTVVIYTSDNGYLWNEHGLWRKNKPYEESVRVPFIVAMPGVRARADAHIVSPVLDVGPTIYDLADIPRASDGTSLMPLLRNPGADWRGEAFLEHNFSAGHGNALWAGLVRQRWKYVRYWTGEEELYDLQEDPYELRSRHDDAALETLKASMAARVDEQLGLAIVPTVPFPKATVSRAYSYRFQPWGGEAPFRWTVSRGQLPPGLTLDANTGRLTGTPRVAGQYSFRVRVDDGGNEEQSGRARSFSTRTLVLTVGA